MNKLKQLVQQKKNLLSIYFTAGYPNLNDTVPVLNQLQTSKVDFVEIGLPFSDPLADGNTIQRSSTKALDNGMNTHLLLQQLQGIKTKIQMPLVVMGYLNPMLQFGFESFLEQCARIGVDGLIVPDLPLEIYESTYKELFNQHGISNIFLITPQTTEARIREIDKLSNSFIYAVSSASVTGKTNEFSKEQIDYFKRIQSYQLKTPHIIGFGIHNANTYKTACQYSSGAIVGSAFVNHISQHGIDSIAEFVNGIKKVSS